MRTEFEHAANAGISGATAGDAIREALETHADEILETLRVYVVRANLSRSEPVADTAFELFAELCVEAINHAGRWDPERRPLPWLLGIGARLVQRWRVGEAKRARREPLVQDLAGDVDEPMSDDDLFHLLARAANPAASQRLEAQARVEELLFPASEADRRVIRLAVVHDLDGEELARELGVLPGAARTRLHRALVRLRQAHERRPAEEDGEE